MRSRSHFLAPIALGIGALLAGVIPAAAGSLQIEPVLVEVSAPSAASSVTLRNEGPAPVQAQIRVFRWSQTNGEEKLEPTQDVVASPPALAVDPKRPNIVRVVRLRKAPATQEESYRLVVDQLPSRAQEQNGKINLILSHSIPVFFGPATGTGAAVSWSVKTLGGRLQVTAQNKGNRRLRIAGLKIRDAKGTDVAFGDGLIGYALAGSTMRWSVPLGSRHLGQGAISVSAQGDTGSIRAVATSIPGP